MTIAVLLLAAPLFSETNEAQYYDLDGIKHMDQFVGSQAARKQLSRAGFVVTGQQFKQIFEPYISCPLPMFITADSAWHTYHVLLEEGVRSIEESQAGLLRDFSAALISAALKRSKRADDPYADVARFAAVGLALQDKDAAAKLAAGLETAEVVDRLENSRFPFMPLFFSLPVMPQRFRACSFYTKSPVLKRYFAARTWYAVCCFRAKSKKETERAVRLVLLINNNTELKEMYEQLVRPYDVLLGPPDDGDLSAYTSMIGNVLGAHPETGRVAANLDELCAAARKRSGPKINDQILPPDRYLDFAEEIKGFRLFPPRRLPSAVLFQNTVDPVVKGRMFPSGIDVASVGPLASDAGRRALKLSVKAEQLAAIRTKVDAVPLPKSLHGEAIKLLSFLQNPLPGTAPGALRSVTWHDKQLWTQLGAWAEQRHTWALHTKLDVYYLGFSKSNPGVVSPYPAFFSGLAQLARTTSQELSRPALCGKRNVKGAGRTERSMEHETEQSPAIQQRKISKMLNEFAGLCDNLAAIAAKQSVGTPLTDEDRRFLACYGMKLAYFHFYRGNSWCSPEDDFPMVVPIFSSLLRDEVLYAGLARPEALYVIAEYGGKPVLYRGAVLSYREFRRSVAEPLDDEAWKVQVRRGRIPDPPTFTASFRNTITSGEVCRIIEAGGTYEVVDAVPGTDITKSMIRKLLGKESRPEHWLVEHLCSRAGEEDVGDLIQILQSVKWYHVGDVTNCLAKLPWKKHAGILTKLLEHATIRLADAAAFIMSNAPDDIDVDMLVERFDRQSTRTKRLYCFLLGHVENPGSRAADLILKAMKSKNAGLRYEACRAVIKGKLNTPPIKTALIRNLKDPNCVVAAAAAGALAAVDAREAAPVMLEMLKQVQQGTIRGWASDDHKEEVFSGTSYSGRVDHMVLSQEWDGPFGPLGERMTDENGAAMILSFEEELIEGLCRFEYQPAAALIRELFRRGDGDETLRKKVLQWDETQQ